MRPQSKLATRETPADLTPREGQDTCEPHPAGKCERRRVPPRNRDKARGDPNSTTVTCYDCVYAVWDRNQWMRALGVSWGIRPTCANHPDSQGVMREIPCDGPCRNFRWKAESRGRVTPPQPSSPDIAYIPLTKRKFAIVDKADYERLCRYKWFVMDGRKGAFYAGRKEGYRIITMHIEIMRPPPGMVVHHINHNGLDNRRCNLQICTPEEHGRYRQLGVTASGFIGVYRYGKRWRALVQSKGEVLYEEVFDDKVEAAKARDRKAVEFLGESARVNFPNLRQQTPPTPPAD